VPPVVQHAAIVLTLRSQRDPPAVVRGCATVVASGLAAVYGDRQLFSDLDLVIAPAGVIGLVGVNSAPIKTLSGM
jgi:hypothetical protein